MKNKINVKMAYTDFHGMVEASNYAYDKYKTEVSGYLNIIARHENPDDISSPIEFWAGYPSVLKQECTVATTTLDKKAIIEHCAEEAELNCDILENLYFCWWHTHHTMKAYFSGTDEATILEYAEKGPTFAIVVNNAGEYDARYAAPIELPNGRKHIVHFDVELDIYHDEDYKHLHVEIDENLAVKKMQIPRKPYLDEDFPFIDPRQESLEAQLFADRMDAENERMMENGMIQGDPDKEADIMEEDIRWIDDGEKEIIKEIELEADEDDLPEIEEEFPFKPEPVPGTEEVKEKTPKTLTRTNTLLSKIDNSELDKEETKKKIISNINNCIYNYSIDHVDEEGCLKYINELVNGLKGYDMKLHVLSSMDDIIHFNDLIVTEIGDYNESTYSEISKHIQS